MNKKEIRSGIEHIAENDPILGSIISRTAEFNLKAHDDHYNSLLRAIIGQQLSMKAADSIVMKVWNYFNGIPSAKLISDTEPEILRGLGLSNAKVRYAKDLAEKVLEGSLNFTGIKKKSDEEIIEMLTAVKGIGVWTAHMFLIFTLCRPNVLPVGDFGIKRAIMLNYNLDQLPKETEVHEISQKNNWAPYNSIASWYLWKSLENNI